MTLESRLTAAYSSISDLQCELSKLKLKRDAALISVRTLEAERVLLTDVNKQLLDALKRMEYMHKLMMNKVNHASSFYDAETIKEMNEAPNQAREIIDMLGG